MANTIRRRRLLKMGAAAAAAGAGAACSARKSSWLFFTVEEAKTVEAITDQIVPPDQDPGAAAAGVVAFIDRQLMGFHKPFQQAYRQGLARVDALSREMSGAPFAEAPAEKQLALMTALEKNKTAWKEGKAFFDMIVSHTMQGFYGAPRHGGNRGAVSWRMLGVPVPPVRGRDQYDFRKG